VGGGIGGAFEFQGTNISPRLLRRSQPATSESGVSPAYSSFRPALQQTQTSAERILWSLAAAPARTGSAANNKLKGALGRGDDVQRWGVNRVRGIVNGAPAWGELLQANFVAAGRNEAQLSGGDSGGAVYIKDGKFFKLAGINYAVDGPFNTTTPVRAFKPPSSTDAVLPANSP